MARVTVRDIEGRLSVLNSNVEDRGVRFRLGGSYGKSQIEMLRTDTDKPGVVWASSPLGTKRETWEWLNAFIDGMSFQRRGKF